MSVPNTFASATTAIPLANLDADFAYYDAAFQIVGTAMEVNYTFRLEDPTDTTKKAEFVMSGITTGTTRQYTMPNVTGALASLGNISQTFTGSTSIVPTTAGSAITIGGNSSTGTITLGRSTASQTIDIAVGATAAASTKTVNIGTTGVSTSTTNINYGSSVTGALVTHIWNAGANNMRLDSAGNLGIGTTSPAYKLDTDGSAVRFTRSSKYLIINPNYNAANTNADLEISSGMALTFSIGGGAEKMRLDSAGNLGIGTTSPLGKLHSSSSSSGAMLSGNANQLIAESSGNAGLTIATGASSLGNIFFADSGDAADGYVQYDQSGRSMRFGTAAAERMRLDSSGNLGIGTTSPSYAVDVQRAGTASIRIKSTIAGAGATLALDTGATAGNSNQILFVTNAVNKWALGGKDIGSASGDLFSLYNYAATANAFTVSAANNFGIGTTSPVSILEVKAANPTLTISASGTTGSTNTLTFKTGFSGVNGDQNIAGVNAELRISGSTVGGSGAFVSFYSGNAEGMRLDNNRSLCIGTTSASASAILDVQSTTKGVRMPNMTTTQKNAISSPAAGLMVFDTTLAKLCVYSGAAWQTITSI